MPARTKKTVSKEVSEMKFVVRESYSFREPMAASSPNVERKNIKSSEVINLIQLRRTLEMLCEKEIKEEIDRKEIFEEELKKKCDLFCLKINPDLLFYTCNVDNNSELEKKENKNKNKRLREDDFLMPPPNPIKKDGKRTGKRIRNDSEDTKASNTRSVQTRSSARIFEQSLNSETSSQKKNEEHPQNDSYHMKTPATKGFLRRNRHNIATVTPGPNVNAPQTILRRPNPGETAISLSGSPLLVASDQTSAVPQITIPLRDGRVMAVLARDGLNPADFPNMDSQTLSRLKMLHEFLGKL